MYEKPELESSNFIVGDIITAIKSRVKNSCSLYGNYVVVSVIHRWARIELSLGKKEYQHIICNSKPDGNGWCNDCLLLLLPLNTNTNNINTITAGGAYFEKTKKFNKENHIKFIDDKINAIKSLLLYNNANAGFKTDIEIFKISNPDNKHYFI